MDIRIGNGYDVHALAAGLPMWLGGVQIPSENGFVAHSDGDVAIHALCDALLGALGLGDIGHLFPDTDPAWKGVDSKLLLEKVVSLLAEYGYMAGNVDITIALQQPKLAPYINPMRVTLANILGLTPDRVSVKATTTERLGFVGRGEGCEVWATALVIGGIGHGGGCGGHGGGCGGHADGCGGHGGHGDGHCGCHGEGEGHCGCGHHE